MTECDWGDLLEQARLMLLRASYSAGEMASLIGELRQCADQVFASDPHAAHNLQRSADELERRLLAG